MTHDEAEDFLAHFGKKGMKWGQRAANPKYGERGAFDREILNARAKYEAQGPGAKQAVKTARSAYRQDKTAGNKEALKTAKNQRRKLNAETTLRTVATGREVGRDILITAGTYSVLALAAKAVIK